MARSSAYLFALLLLSGSLSGCETFQSLGDKIKSIDLSPSAAKSEAPAGTSSAAPETKTLAAELPEKCPQLKILGDLSQITQFANPKSPLDGTIIAKATFSGIDASCQVTPNAVILDIALDFDGTLGPVGLRSSGNGEANYTYPYFLSVVTPEGNIMSKDVFALTMVYEAGVPTLHKQDRLRQTIPLAQGQLANQFQIVVGFQLNADELSYNRSAKQ